jgi:hypothetical protein
MSIDPSKPATKTSGIAMSTCPNVHQAPQSAVLLVVKSSHIAGEEIKCTHLTTLRYESAGQLTEIHLK